MELSVADLLMALSIHSAFPQLLQQKKQKKKNSVQFHCFEAKDKINFPGNALTERIVMRVQLTR